MSQSLLLVRALGWTLLWVTMGACRSSETPQSEARALLTTHCGHCHLPGRATSREAALKIFDLSRDDWWAGMSAAQLEKSAQMFAERVNLTDPELAEFSQGGATLRRPTPEEVERYRQATQALANQR